MPVRDKKDFLVECLDTVLPAVHAYGAELITVDNGSTDGAWEVLSDRLRGQAVLLRSDSPTVAGVRNLGASCATGSIFCFIDSDCAVPADYLDRVVAVLAATGAGAVGHKVSFPDRSWIERCWHNLHFIVEEGGTRWLPGACFSVTAEAFHKVGGFRDDLVSGEDIELAARLARGGFLVWSSPRLIITHLDNPDSLASFYRKEVWRGQGVSASGSVFLNRVLVMTFAHLVLCALAVIGLFLAPGRIAARVGLALVLVFLVPVVSVAFRIRQVRRGGMRPRWWRELLPSAVLYGVYYLARGWAAIRVWSSGRRSSTAP